jgi:hypothetical protein
MVCCGNLDKGLHWNIQTKWRTMVIHLLMRRNTIGRCDEMKWNGME